MTIELNDVTDNLRHIKLTGRLDIPGTNAVSDEFTELAVVENKRVVVDLSGVTFLASIGIWLLLSAAKSLQRRGGRLALFVGNNHAVAKTLHATDIDALLPTYTQVDEADKAATA